MLGRPIVAADLLGRRVALVTGFGELRHAGRAFGAPGAVELFLSWLEVGLPLLALVYLLRRLPPPARLRFSAALFGGLAAGLVLWMAAVGPVVLPN